MKLFEAAQTETEFSPSYMYIIEIQYKIGNEDVIYEYIASNSTIPSLDEASSTALKLLTTSDGLSGIKKDSIRILELYLSDDEFKELRGAGSKISAERLDTLLDRNNEARKRLTADGHGHHENGISICSRG